MLAFCHAGLEEPAPYADTGASRRCPDEPRIGSGAGVGNHLKDWLPVFTGNPGFRLSPE